MPPAEPRLDVGYRPWAGLEGRHAVGNPLVVDTRDRRSVVRGRPACAHRLPGLPRKLLEHVRGPVDVAQRLQDGPHVDSEGAALTVVELVVPGQRLRIAVEDDADELVAAIDHRRAGIASDNVGGGD